MQPPASRESLLSTCQYLAQHARCQPAAIALVHGDLRLTYRRLAEHVVAVMDDLSAAGLTHGHVLGVELDDRVLHLLILLAAEQLGITTLSLIRPELGPPANLDHLCDRILLADPAAAPPSDKSLAMPVDWLADILARPVAAHRLVQLDTRPAPEALVRLIKSSGTTGTPKVMGMTLRVQQGVIRKIMEHAPPWVIARPSYLCVYNFTVRACHSRTLFALQRGGTVYLIGTNVIWNLITAGIGNYALFIVGDLERLIRAAPLGHTPSPLYLDVIGAAVPPRLLQETRAKLTQHIVVSYSSNEANRVSIVDDDGVGTLCSDVQIRIVDGRGQTLPTGQSGLIRIRSDTMTDGYVNAPELNRTNFVDGWFHTSDIGFQPAPGKLVVLGRDDDMLNIGGVKIAPTPIEQSLRALDGIRDALVTTLDDHLQTRVMLVAVETTPNAGSADLTARIAPIIQSYVAVFHLLLLPVFPRTENGKIRRDVVKDVYRRQAERL